MHFGDDGVFDVVGFLWKGGAGAELLMRRARPQRSVLGYVKHPFIVGLKMAFQTRDKLFFVLDYCAGGELFFHLGKVRHGARFSLEWPPLARGPSSPCTRLFSMRLSFGFGVHQSAAKLGVPLYGSK